MSATLHALPVRPRSRGGEHTLHGATVAGRCGDHFLLDHPGAPQARLAASCLLVPEPGDTVLITHAEDGAECFVLAVLERKAPESGQIHFPGGNTLHSSAQGVRFTAEAMTLATRSRLELNSPELGVSAVAADMNVKHAHSCFETLDTQAVSINLTAKTFSAQVGRMIQRLMESFRKVRGLDETRAGRVRVSAEDHHQIDAGHVTHVARGFVKIDGSKINLG